MTKPNKLVEKGLAGMTPKQAKFLKLWLEHGNASKAAMEAYNCKNMMSAANIGSEVLSKLKNPMKLFLEQHGFGLTHLVKIVLEATTAVKTDITGDKHPDYRVRLEAADRLSKWLDAETKSVGVAIQVNNQITAEDFFK